MNADREPDVKEEPTRGLPPATPDSRTLPWVAPFAVFALWLLLGKEIPLGWPAKEILLDTVVLASIIGFSWRVLPRAAPHWLASIALGLVVFVLWIAPDTLVPGWRDHWIFQNAVTGEVKTTIPAAELTPVMLVLRTNRRFWRSRPGRALHPHRRGLPGISGSTNASAS